jgi:hypothetical protein
VRAWDSDELVFAAGGIESVAESFRSGEVKPMFTLASSKIRDAEEDFLKSFPSIDARIKN